MATRIAPFAILMLIAFHGGADAVKLVCPPEADIFPVNCTVQTLDDGTVLSSIIYDKRTKSANEIASAVIKIRAASKAQASDLLDMTSLTFLNLGDSVESLDLTVFGKNNITFLQVIGAFPAISGSQLGNLFVESLYVVGSPNFGKFNLDVVLSDLDSKTLKTLIVQNSSVSGIPRTIISFPNLHTLYLLQEDVKTISSSQFRGNPNLNWLYLYDTGLTEIQERAFDAFVDSRRTERQLYVLLAKQPDLEDENISPNSGLSDIEGIVLVQLSQTGVTSLSAENWQRFLMVKSRQLMFMQNPLECGPKMRWLKDDKARVEKQVYAAKCGNDNGKTVFNSALV